MRHFTVLNQDKTYPSGVCKQLAIQTFRRGTKTAAVSYYKTALKYFISLPSSMPSYMSLLVRRKTGTQIMTVLLMYLQDSKSQVKSLDSK